MPMPDEKFDGLWLLVPVKPFDEAKSRLASILDVTERGNLMRRLLKGVLKAAHASHLFAGVGVISRDAEALALAEASGAISLRELANSSDSSREPDNDPNQMLNRALEEGRAALPASARALLVLPADLPEISADGLRAFVQAAELKHGTPVVAIAPSVSGGTNALLLAPPNVIPFAFGVEDGVESSDRHAALAMQAGARLVTVRSSALAFDVDLPEEYMLLPEADRS